MKPNENVMNHLSDELLSERLDGLLDVAAQERVDAHLAECADCAARYAGLRQVQATLRALRQVEDIPDFRLNAQGRPRRLRLRPESSRPSRGYVFARMASVAVLVGGVLLLFVAIITGAGSLTLTSHESAANYSNAAPASQSYPGCTTMHCPAVGTPLPGNNDGAVKTPTMVPTPVGGQSNTTFAPLKPPAPFPSPLAEFGLGMLLALGGLIAFLGFGRRERST